MTLPCASSGLLRFCLFLILTSITNASANPAAGTKSRPLTHVRLQLKWRHQFQFAGYYVAEYMGFYREHGLDVTLLEGGPEVEPMQSVIENRAEFGVGTTDLLLLRSKARPVVLLADIFQHSPLALMTRASHPSSNIHDLVRGRLMIEPDSAELFAYFNAEGIDIGSLNIIDHYDIQEFLDSDHDIDAISVYITHGPFILKEQGIDYRLYRPIESGIDFYGDNLFTVQPIIDEHPEMVQAFLEASLQGWKYALLNREEVIDYILTNYPGRRSRNSLLFEAEKMDKLILPDIVEVGYINTSRWEKILKYYQEAGFIHGSPNLEGFIYSIPDSRLSVWPKLWRQYKNSIALGTLLFAIIILIAYNLQLKRHVKSRTHDLQEALLARSRFMAAAGHDLRQPLHATGFFIQTLQAQLSSTEQKQTLGKIQGCVDNLNDSFNKLLDAAHLERGDIVVKRVDFELHPMLDKLEAVFHPAAVSKGIELRIHACDKTVNSDPALLERILANLLSNAIRYTDKGRVEISCVDDNSLVDIHVADTGVGIASDRIQDIFNEFTRLTHSDKNQDRNSGLGLGLFITRQLAELLNHPLRVTSTPNLGSDFYITLPVGSGEPVVKTETPSSQLPNRLDGLQVLAIDDDEEILLSMKGLMENWGCHYSGARSSNQALQLVMNGFQPRFILADFQLADDMDGVDTVNRIRELAGEHIPAIIITGTTDKQAHTKIRSNDLDSMPKPVRPANLRVYMNNIFNNMADPDVVVRR